MINNNDDILRTLSICILEDDGAIIPPLIELLPCKALYIYNSIDEAYNSLVEDEIYKQVDLFIFDLYLAKPFKIDLGLEQEIKIGLKFHEFLESSLSMILPVLFLTAVTNQKPELEIFIKSYVDKCPSSRTYKEKTAGIEEIKKSLISIYKAK